MKYRLRLPEISIDIGDLVQFHDEERAVDIVRVAIVTTLNDNDEIHLAIMKDVREQLQKYELDPFVSFWPDRPTKDEKGKLLGFDADDPTLMKAAKEQSS